MYLLFQPLGIDVIINMYLLIQPLGDRSPNVIIIICIYIYIYMYVSYNQFIFCKVQKPTFLHGASVGDLSDKVSNCEITLHLHAIFLAQAYSFYECNKIGIFVIGRD